MKKYKIADLIVHLESKSERVIRQGKIYEIPPDSRFNDFSPDIIIKPSKEKLEKMFRENPHLTFDECDYIETGSIFYYKLLRYNGFMLHASAIAYEDNAYLFSAPSGTGKSTHTDQWQQYFGTEKAIIINDDKPAIRLIDNRFYVFGTPWSGKSDKNLDIKVPLKGIVFLEQSPENWIQSISVSEAIYLIFNQTLFALTQDQMNVLLSLLDQLLSRMVIFKMGCTISQEAVELAYQTLNQKQQEIQQQEL
ncbi:MAG: hypothetical protein Q4C95_04590 [Planctomycetia bacterium]|nr:hypothetical protein [Planctomycetia bacterium]